MHDTPAPALIAEEQRAATPAMPSGDAGGAHGSADFKYRLDVDGLRAIAVLAVVLFHAAPARLPGGFVGVDVFFVISGFLITGIIAQAYERGTFTYRDFYARRIRRIFPALAIALATTLAIGWAILLPDEFAQLGKHTFAGSFFFANLAYWREAGYFDVAAQMKPLLHLWSLGVEEQYYIVWPVLLGAIWKFKRARLAIIILAALVSFGLSLWLTFTRPSAAFYLPFTRFWELAVGGLIAVYARGRAGTTTHAPFEWLRKHEVFRDALSVGGLLAILATCIWVTESVAFPGWVATLPVFGTAVILIVGPSALCNRALLSNRTAVFFGIISYPLYLLHWPFLTYARFLEEDGSGSSIVLRLAAVLTAIGGAYAIYRLFEIPTRKSKHVARVVTAAVAAVALVGVLGRVVELGAIQPRLQGNVSVAAITEAKSDWGFPRASSTVVLAGNTADTVLLAGDSHMQQYYPAVAAALETRARKPTALFLTTAGCPFLPRVNRTQPGFQCDRAYTRVIASAQQPGVRTLVIAAFWKGYFEPGEAYTSSVIEMDGRTATESLTRSSFEQLTVDLAALTRSGKKVIVVGIQPSDPSFDPAALANDLRNPFRRQSVPDYTASLALDVLHAQSAWLKQQLLAVAAGSGAVYVDPTDYLCAEGQCPAWDGDRPRYKDANHVRPFATVKFLSYVSSFVEIHPGERDAGS